MAYPDPGSRLPGSGVCVGKKLQTCSRRLGSSLPKKNSSNGPQPSLQLTVRHKGPVEHVGGHEKPVCPLGWSVLLILIFIDLTDLLVPPAEGASRPSSPPPPASQAPPAPPAPARGTQKPRGGPAARGGKYYARGGATKPPSKDANPNQNGVEEPIAGEGQRRCKPTITQLGSSSIQRPYR